MLPPPARLPRAGAPAPRSRPHAPPAVASIGATCARSRPPAGAFDRLRHGQRDRRLRWQSTASPATAPADRIAPLAARSPQRPRGGEFRLPRAGRRRAVRCPRARTARTGPDPGTDTCQAKLLRLPAMRSNGAAASAAVSSAQRARSAPRVQPPAHSACMAVSPVRDREAFVMAPLPVAAQRQHRVQQEQQRGGGETLPGGEHCRREVQHHPVQPVFEHLARNHPGGEHAAPRDRRIEIRHPGRRALPRDHPAIHQREDGDGGPGQRVLPRRPAADGRAVPRTRSRARNASHRSTWRRRRPAAPPASPGPLAQRRRGRAAR